MPGLGPMFSIGPDDMELGLGLHGEAGVRRVKVNTITDILEELYIYAQQAAQRMCIGHIFALIRGGGPLIQLHRYWKSQLYLCPTSCSDNVYGTGI